MPDCSSVKIGLMGSMLGKEIEGVSCKQYSRSPNPNCWKYKLGKCTLLTFIVQPCADDSGTYSEFTMM